MKKRKKKKGILLSLLDGFLSLIDLICEGVAGAAVWLMAAAGRGLFMLGRGLVWLIGRLAGAMLAVPAYILRKLTAKRNTAARCLRLSGPEFEAYVALVLADNGFKHVEITKGSGDQGVDILAERGGRIYAVQCKNYEGAVGNFAVQEAYAGAQFYGCDVAAVICPGTFTRGAKELAQSTGVLLWDGKKLSHMMRISGRRPRHISKQ